MNRLHRGMRVLALGAVLAGSMSLATALHSFAQDQTLNATQRAQLAAITLDQESLPSGYTLSGEAFLTADQVASGDVSGSSLTDAGFLGQYVSIYSNGAENGRIRIYSSLWSDDAAAENGFGLLEDETTSAPDASLSDSATDIGEEPRELTTGTYTDGDRTIGTADVTFRNGSFLVGVAVERTDGQEASTDTATALATTAADRAATVAESNNPEFADLTLPVQALAISGLGTEVQAGFISPAEAEAIYGLQGSDLGKLTAAWTDTVGVGEGDSQAPYITVGLTTFGSADEAKAVVSSAADLTTLTNSTTISDATVDGADAAVAFEFTSDVTGGDATNSYRIIFAKDTTLVVIDVQAASDAGKAKSAAESLANAQLSCIGQTECAAPSLPDDFTS